MKKILSILASVGLTSIAATSVVACGNKASSPVENKTSLGSLETLNKTVKGLPGMTTWIEALDDFLKDDANKTLTGEVEVKNEDVDWIAPQLGVNGSLTITAKPNSSYTGSITVIVPGYTMTLESLLSNLTLTIDGSVEMTPEQTLEAFLKIGDNVILKDEVIIKEGSFEAPPLRSMENSLLYQNKVLLNIQENLKVSLVNYQAILQLIINIISLIYWIF